ncbi:MAG: Smr/MutS family protein [Mucinivorans sp.]
MIYPNDFPLRVGFERVAQGVSSLCNTACAAQMVEQASFMTDYHSVVAEQSRCHQMRAVVMLEGDFPREGYTDINHFLLKARVLGNYLSAEELVELRKALELLAALRRFFASKANNPYPLLLELIAPVADFSFLLGQIESIIDKFGRIKDTASPALRDIRAEIHLKSSQISKRLQQILHSAQAEGYAEADSSITIREGRALIPVVAGAKRKVRGMVHSESATGRTAYIEPIEVVELNNEIREAEAAEKREIIKILTLFTESLRPYIDQLLQAGVVIATFDFLMAKALYGITINATMPIIEDSQQILLRSARHPQLEAALKKEGKSIVPLSLELDSQKRILLISGPNAGGKSVCLKTVGLMQYMLQCGFPVPLLDNSQMGIFDSLFIDIGDQQSLEDDLSTYSSHLSNMKTLLGGATERSLFLIDEFGSGTEPHTGGAISEAILEQLLLRGAFGVITTHYANLKYFATSATGIENGAMTFDVQHIRPLFRLEQGRAGSSFAFEIARKIGLPESIISRANEKIGTEQVNLEKQLREAARDKRYWENKRERIRQTEKSAFQTATQYEAELSEIQAKRRELIAAAKAEARELVAEANRQIERTIREVREAAASAQSTKEVRAEFNTFRQELASSVPTAQDEIDRKIELLRQKEQRRIERTAQRAASRAEAAPVAQPKAQIALSVGANVRMRGQQTVGRILSISGNKCTVAFGNIITPLDGKRLDIVAPEQVKKEVPLASVQSYNTLEKKVNFYEQLDIRGSRVADAIPVVQSFIDEAVMLGFHSVKILHGKGTGALKQDVRQYLATLPFVKSLRDEHEEFGGAGITVVEID